MKNRVFAALAATCLVAGILMGCGSQAPEASAGQKTAVDTGSAPVEQSTPSAKESIGLAAAKKIAFAQSGVREADAEGLIAEYQDENNSYLILFSVGKTEYQYGVDAASGEVIMESAVETESEDKKEEGGISRKKAEKIALKHAGIKRAVVDYIDTQKDMEDGISVYEIEFTADGVEYEYEINAENGDIMFAESEDQDFD